MARLLRWVLRRSPSGSGRLYFEVARVPERGWLLAAIGLLGKVLGPVGLVILIWRGTWPVAAGIFCMVNDLVGWIPFTLHLYDARPWRLRSVA